ncbi:MAG: hypothetical protein HRU41_27000 [Saprospiraceae bacterium]|nr:hypothetical protein [Saprospiraceae bacterium]
MRLFILLLLLGSTVFLSAQPNCEAYKYFGDELKYKACKAAEKRAGYYQFSRRYQEALDEAIAIDSTFAFAYRAKSTAYLKSGDFLEWKYLMDKAVKFDPTAQLDYRGWCRYQFFRDYQGAIDDIELLDSLVAYDIGHSVNGDYHLHIARALCYKALGEKERAIEIIEGQVQDSTYFVGIYDFLHLGVLYLETEQYEEAMVAFARQEKENDLAELHYYRALVHKATGAPEAYQEELRIAKHLYLEDRKMFDPYVEQMDKVYLSTIEKALAAER